MFLISRNFFSFKFTLFVLISLNIAFSHGAKKQGNKHYHVLHIDPLSKKPNCSAHKTGLGSHEIKLLQIYGPCLPFSNSVEVRSSHEILDKNEARVQWLNSRISYSNSHTTMDESDAKSPERAPSLGDSAQYLTTIGLGTPKVDYEVMIDTGSDYTWVRCRPCQKGCRTSMSPLFDPSKSSTYRNGSTEFRQEYEDHSYTEGFWSYDTLTIEPSHVINMFKFGCGQYNVGNPDDFTHAAGILGLGIGKDSLVSQSAPKFGKIFGYCLPKSGNNGYLLFGDEARKISSLPTLQFTELRTNPRDSLYHLQLVGISVAGKRLNIESGVFTSVGTIIDSGTVVTHLPRKAYNALSSAFNQSMSAYQRASPQELLDTCFIVKSGQSIVIPSITFHFAGGTDVALDQSGIGWTPEKKDIWCLGFTATKNDGDLTIIGNTQQREMEVLYDVEAGKIGFGRKSCGN